MDLNRKGCIVRDEKRDKIDQKEYKNRLRFKELRTAASKLSYTLINMKRLTFFPLKELFKRKDI